jgi:hypothetical protein
VGGGKYDITAEAINPNEAGTKSVPDAYWISIRATARGPGLGSRERGLDSKGHVSPDGHWVWDGKKWIATGTPVVQPTLAKVRQIPGLSSGLAWKLPALGVATLLGLWAIGSSISQPPSTPVGHQVADVRSSATPFTETNAPPPSHAPIESPSPSPSPQPVAPVAPPPPPPPPPPPVQAPYAAATAAGASAVCADGTWSYSKTRSGTCSHHGGVHWWTGNLGPAGPGAH